MRFKFLDDGEEILTTAGVPSPRSDCEWLMAAALGIRRSELALAGDASLTGDRRRRWEEFIELRRRRIPLQQILGSVHFCGLELAVSADALIPRHETEMLIDMLIMRFRKNPPRSIVDLGTGSGACILALANAFPEATLTACDLSEAALNLAKRNEKACGMGGRIAFVTSDWFSAMDGIWDLIVANPPYLTEDEWLSAEPEVRCGDPKMALVGGGVDGADGLRTIIGTAPKHMADGGMLALEMGISHGETLLRFADSVGLLARTVNDLSGRERFLLATK